MQAGLFAIFCRIVRFILTVDWVHFWFDSDMEYLWRWENDYNGEKR